MNKRGISSVIRNFIIIAVLFVAIIIVFILLYNIVYSETETLPEVSMSILKSSVKIDNHDVSLDVKYNEGTAEIDQIRFAVYDGINIENIDLPALDLKAPEQKSFQFKTSNVSTVKSISIIPIIKQNNEEVTLSVADTYRVKTLSAQSLANCGNNIFDSGEECDDGNKFNGDGCSDTCEIETCLEQNGYVCLSGKVCTGKQLTTPKTTEICCKSSCVTPTLTKCSECSSGFSLCSKDKCNSITEKCYYKGSGKCLTCSNLTCSDYINSVDCNDDKCGLDCKWSTSVTGSLIVNLMTGKAISGSCVSSSYVEPVQRVCDEGQCSGTKICTNNAWVTHCGNGACDCSETNANCAADCPASCGNGVCETGETCSNCVSDCGICKLANGQTCSSGTECISGNCADGYCCDTSCTSTCKSCNIAGHLGTCYNDPLGTSCGTSQQCDGNGACKLINGQTCTIGSQCLSGNCVSGTCCNVASCSGSHYSCDGGTCSTPYSCTAGMCIIGFGDSSYCSYPVTYCPNGEYVAGRGLRCFDNTDCSLSSWWDNYAPATCGNPPVQGWVGRSYQCGSCCYVYP